MLAELSVLLPRCSRSLVCFLALALQHTAGPLGLAQILLHPSLVVVPSPPAVEHGSAQPLGQELGRWGGEPDASEELVPVAHFRYRFAPRLHRLLQLVGGAAEARVEVSFCLTD